MKPIYLEFCGINSFSEKTQIDFRTLLFGGVFGIFGDTGSGKSTILDCIHLALYGVIERASKSMADCINYGADSAYVVFDFEITTDGVRHAYRVRRERKRKNGATKAFLYEYTDSGEQLALAEGTRDVDEALEKIIGLTFNDFKMCIALPQGDFSALVKAATAERVKLVSRLFDLERYGERLTKSVNEQYFKAENEVALIKAEMGQNEGGRVELIEEKQQQIVKDRAALVETEEKLKKTEAEHEKIATLLREKTQYEEICQRFSTMQTHLTEMEEKRKAAERLPLAKLVVDKANAIQNNLKEKAEAQRQALLAGENRKKAESTLADCKKRLAESKFDENILALSVQLEKVRSAKADREEEQKLSKLLSEHREKYLTLKSKCVEEDFEGKRNALETQITELGEDDSLLGYLKRNFKDVLLADTYGEIRADIRALQEKYPVIEQDAAVLLKKYAPIEQSGEKELDIAKINLAFKEIEQKRKALKLELEQLEKRKRTYDDICAEMKTVKTQGEYYRQSHDLALERIAFLKDLDSEENLERKLKAEQGAKEKAQKSVDEAQEDLQRFHAAAEKQSGLVSAHTKMERALEDALDAALRESGFVSEEDARSLIVTLGDEQTVKAECKAFFEKYELYKSKKEETDEKKFIGVEEETLQLAREKKTILQGEKDALNRQIATAETELKQLLSLREKYQAFEKALVEKEKRKNICDELRLLLRNNRFLEFIASEYLQEICVSASKTLLSLTNGRYFLRYDKEFKVGDNLGGGNLRAVKTLSGGETFLVSLSLALSLSGAICQKSLRPIEFFFLDEGFGTLDGKLVDTVMDVLGKLSKDFSVGLISHVEELKHRIDNKILVTGATETHGSRVKIEHF